MGINRGVDYEEKQYKAYGDWLQATWPTDEDDERYGFIVTPAGICQVFQWIPADHSRLGETTRIWFYIDGREYVREWSKFYSKRFTKTLARRMAEEITARHKEEEEA